MRKSTVIAQCLVNSKMVTSFDEAEHTVKVVFNQEFLDQDFNKWNNNIDDVAAENIINTVGKASRINVKRFIEDMW